MITPVSSLDYPSIQIIMVLANSLIPIPLSLIPNIFPDPHHRSISCLVITHSGYNIHVMSCKHHTADVLRN